MARIDGVQREKASLVSKVLFWAVRRRMGRVSEPWEIAAHVTQLHFGRALFELVLDRSRQVPRRLRKLACVKSAMLIGCNT